MKTKGGLLFLFSHNPVPGEDHLHLVLFLFNLQ
jgi:hypothetical protein